LSNEEAFKVEFEGLTIENQKEFFALGSEEN